MIVEERTYTLHPGKVPEYLALYEREGLALQRAALGTLVGYFSTEVGTLNQVVHLWAYQDLEDRSRRRAELLADPDWQAYFARVAPLLQAMESRLLVPAPFSPLGGTR
jgi:hypothetical protein